MKLSNYIIRPIVTEKSIALASQGKYVFEVMRNSTKDGVAQEIKRLFNVDAVSVNTVVLPGKKRRILGTRKYMKTSNMKKAIVQLKEGQKIDLFPKE